MRLTPYQQLTVGNLGVGILEYYDGSLLRDMVTRNTLFV